MFKISVLASGSSGNCFYIESEKSKILIDVGISAKQITERLDSIGKNIGDIHAIFISHEHSDHIKGAEILYRKYNIPIYMTGGTALQSMLDIQPSFLVPNKPLVFKDMHIMPFSKSHDAAQPISFWIKNSTKAVAIITDVGHSCHNVKKYVTQSDAVILETNHDISMLKNGRYTEELKTRIRSPLGHLSNYDAGLLLLEYASPKLKHIFLAHLSENNNTPKLAEQTMQLMLNQRKDITAQLWLTSKDKPTSLVTLS